MIMTDRQNAEIDSNLANTQTCDLSVMEERKGYKHTKFGWIPEEWEIKSLENIGDFSKGKGISKNEITTTGKPCIRYAEIYTKYNFYTDNFDSYISEESATNSRKISYGDLLFAGSGETIEDIGKCVAFLGKVDAFAGGDIVILSPKEEDSKFLGFLLNHTIANRQKYKLGQGHSVVHIYSSGLKKLKVPIPPLPEQQKIATILSTWDSAIAKQQQLIAAKQQFKKGLMQLLLTGKKRFEGFEREWEEIKLSSVSTFTNGKAHEQDITIDGKFVVVNSKFISTDGKIRKQTNVQASPLNKNDIVMVMSDVPNGRALAKCYIIEENEKYSLNQRICSLKTKTMDVDFLKNQLNRNKYYLKFNDGISQTNLKKKEVLNCPILRPEIKEQQKITLVLNAADKEIELLQKEFGHLRVQKRGLMQKLLTGNIRVEL